MPAMEELAGALLECLRDVSSLLEHGASVAMRQRDALTQSDAEAIAVACASQEEVLRRLAQADERAAAIAARLAEAGGLDAATADTESIIQAAGDPYASLMARELTHISELARRVRDANEVNSMLLRNGLEIITSCLRIVASEPEPTVYSKGASFAGSGTGVLSLDSRV
jgi:flagellar biosynthesis/type III secretory pathway chaperone